MALYRLTNREMVDLSSTLVAPTHADRRAFMRVPELAPLMPRVDHAHEQLLRADRERLEALLQPITDAQRTVGHRHDWLLRAARLGLRMYIALAQANQDEDRAGLLERLETVLLPDGLREINLSYREKSGRAMLVQARLTPSVRQLLAGMQVDGRSLLELTLERIEAARELGELENQRVGLLTHGRGGDMARARVFWARMIGLVRKMVESLEIDEPTVRQVMDRIARVERVASSRRASAAGARGGDAEVGDESGGEVGGSEADGGSNTGSGGEDTPHEIPPSGVSGVARATRGHQADAPGAIAGLRGSGRPGGQTEQCSPFGPTQPGLVRLT